MRTLAEETRLTMILHGQTDLSKHLLGVIPFGERGTKTTMSWLVMLKLSINQGEDQLQLRWSQDWIQNMKELPLLTFLMKSNNHLMNLLLICLLMIYLKLESKHGHRVKKSLIWNLMILTSFGTIPQSIWDTITKMDKKVSS